MQAVIASNSSQSPKSHLLSDSGNCQSLVKVLVTGANGLVGRALCCELAKRGFLVKAAVRNPKTFVPLEGVTPVLAPDLSDPHASWPLDNVDVVIHAAARVHVMNPAPQEIERFIAVNCDGTLRLARACSAAHVKRFVFLSTIKVNGEFTKPGRPFTADDPVDAPADPYAFSKFRAEQDLLTVNWQNGLEVTVVRVPLVYGPGAKGNLELLERAVRKGLALPIAALYSNRRSLVSLANLVDLLILCGIHPRAAGEVLLVSDGHDLSTLELAQQIAGACGVSLKTFPLPLWALGLIARVLGKGEMMRRLTESLQVDIQKTCHLLGWSPPQSVDQGMEAAFGGEQNSGSSI